MNRVDLQHLANKRIRDARVLLRSRRWDGAYYLAGYAVECGLKACIAKLIKAEEFPDRTLANQCWTHDLGRLVVIAELVDELDDTIGADTVFAANWTKVKDWDESSRYLRIGKTNAMNLYRAITQTHHGVLPWIRARW